MQGNTWRKAGYSKAVESRHVAGTAAAGAC